MIFTILSMTPVWVWGLLALLLALGLWQGRSRRVAPQQLMVLPLVLLGLGLWSMAPRFAALPLAALCWAVSLGLASTWARRLPPPAGTRWLAAEGRLQLPGSWLPLAVIVVIFTLRYSANVAQALHPEWLTAAALQLPLAALHGAISGLLLGRALGLVQVCRR